MKGAQRGMSVKADINKQGWEKSDFPVACDKCYGENPYLRMLKQNYGQQCRLCFRPFTVFKWKGDRGIYKRTCLCNACSKEKNLCQVCTLDLEFGLPMQIRDKRCGVNGKYLMNENFVAENNKKNKPPPPSIPPPPKTIYQEKQEVYIPQAQDSQEQQGGKQVKKITEGEEDEQKLQSKQNMEKKQVQPENEQKESTKDNVNINRQPKEIRQ